MRTIELPNRTEQRMGCRKAVIDRMKKKKKGCK